MNRSRHINLPVQALLASSVIGLAVGNSGDADAEECELVGLQVAAADQPMGAAADQPAEPEFVPGEVIVKFKNAQSAASFDAEAATLPALGEDLGLVRDTSEPTPPGIAVFRVETFSVMSADEMKNRTEQLINQLEQRQDVEYAHPNYIFTTKSATYNDPCYPLQWHYWQNGAAGAETSPGGINLPAAHAVTTGSRDVVVAVLDTGQNFEHPDLNPANFVPGHDFVDNDEDPTDPGRDTGWHGTHVSGTIGGLATNNGRGAVSINQEISIQPIRVLGDGGSGSLLGIINAIYWSAGIPLSGLEENETPAKIINMSLGGRVRCSNVQALQDAVTAAHNQGTLVIAAAGNEASDVSEASPAGCDNVFTVAAGDAEGNLVTRYSNFGNGVEIMAPGGNTRADTNGDGFPDGVLSSVKDRFDLYNGTSMAAPHVAGVAALLAAHSPEMGPPELQQAIVDNALPRDASQCPEACGAGLLSADLQKY
jgi:serine protease